MDTNGKMMDALKNKKGIAAVYVALILLAAVAFVGLAIDIGYMYVAKGQLQNAADAAALAGASKLTLQVDTSAFPSPLIQAQARQAAWKFACKNQAARDNVYLVTKGNLSCDTPPDPSALNSSNNPNGDIVVGNWDSVTRVFTVANGTTGLVINAIKTKARRVTGSPGGEVRLFFGNIFKKPSMGTVAEAYSTYVGPYVGPFPTCFPSCDLLTPIDGRWNYDNAHYKIEPIKCTDEDAGASPPGQRFYFAPSNEEESTPRPGLAWTQFNMSDCATSKCDPTKPGEGGVQDYLQGKPIPNICDKEICTSNGTFGGTVQLLKTIAETHKNDSHAFKAKMLDGNTKDIEVKGWQIYVPVVSDSLCGNTNQPCPGDMSGANPYRVTSFAKVILTEVIDTTPHGVRFVGYKDPEEKEFTVNCGTEKKPEPKTVRRIVSKMSCIPCSDFPPDDDIQPPKLIHPVTVK